MITIQRLGPFFRHLMAYCLSEVAAKASRLVVVMAVARSMDLVSIGIAATALAAADILKALAETGAEPIGKVVIGTVKGDIHDIGKNLVGMMLEGAGFEVIDLGINTDVEQFLGALDEHKPDILGMSALLTTTMPYMKVVIDVLEEKSLRQEYSVIVGGAPLNEEFGEAIGADAYCRDAAVASETASRLVAERRAAAA